MQQSTLEGVFLDDAVLQFWQRVYKKGLKTKVKTKKGVKVYEIPPRSEYIRQKMEERIRLLREGKVRPRREL